jgi:hypothetical protein
MKKALSLILAAGLVLVGVPGGAAMFGPNTVWGVVPEGAEAAVNAVLLDSTGRPVTMLPVVDGRFAFRDLPPGQYTVALQLATGQELARSLPVDLASGSEMEVVFSTQTVPAAVVPPPASTGGGIGTTGWILIGAAAVGITTAIVIATNGNETNVASPSR